MLSLSLRNARTARPSNPLTKMMSLLALARSRRELAKLDARQLADIGVDRRDALEEATRSFWDAPAHWRG
ncbi:MAG: DUF1127 domain-containing protein [Pseudomonadota bacterium]